MLKKWHWITKASAGAILVFVLGCLPAGFTKAKPYVTSDDAEAKRYVISDDAEDGQHSWIDFAETEQDVQTEFAAVYAQPKINLMIRRTKEEESTQKEQMPEILAETAKEEAARQETKENNKEEKTTGRPSTFCTAKDYQVLLNIVQAEAGGCNAIGKILVANVILNRVKSELFPYTITDVVY